MVPPLFHTVVLKERATVLLHSWSPGLAQFVRLKFKVKLSGCEFHGKQSKQEVCMDALRVGAAEFHMVLKKKIRLCLEATVGTFSQHLIH